MLPLKRLRFISFVLCCVTCIFLLGSCHSTKKTAANKPLSKKELKKKYAAILQTKPRKIKNKELYFFIDEWYGVKYKWGGNDKAGVDCSGFTKQLYTTVYKKEVKRTVATLHQSTRNFKRKRRLREGDLVYFQEDDDPSHVGVYLRNGFFVHSAKGKGVHISNINDSYWKRIYKAGGKVKKKS